MKYHGNQHDSPNDKTGVLLINLGTPERPVCPSLRDYLSEFLMDPRVIELPTLLRAILVKGIIINLRSHKSAAAYRQVWTDDGSPLMINTVNLTNKVQHRVGADMQVEVAMRYGNPSIGDKLTLLHDAGVRNIIAIPLYPQYSASTSGSAFDAIAKTLSKQRWVPNLRFISDYHCHPWYIKAIGDSIHAHWAQQGRQQKLLMSFHGLPEKYITRGDPYYAQCQATAKAIAEYLQLSDEQWMLVFQSRLGAQTWLQPYCDATLKALPAQGVKSVDIVCPGFSHDCLETLEEIASENREYFIEAGGQHYSYIPCLNDSDAHVDLMLEIINQASG